MQTQGRGVYIGSVSNELESSFPIIQLSCRWVGPRSRFRDPFFHAFLVLSISEMDLEVVHGCARSRRVEFPRAVVAPNTRKIEEFQLLARVRVRVGHGLHCFRVHSSVPHHRFEGVIRVRLVESSESCY